MKKNASIFFKTIRQPAFSNKNTFVTWRLMMDEIEKLKLHCAEEHFKTVSGTVVKFSKISTYEKLLEIASG